MGPALDRGDDPGRVDLELWTCRFAGTGGAESMGRDARGEYPFDGAGRPAPSLRCVTSGARKPNPSQIPANPQPSAHNLPSDGAYPIGDARGPSHQCYEVWSSMMKNLLTMLWTFCGLIRRPARDGRGPAPSSTRLGPRPTRADPWQLPELPLIGVL